MIILYIELFPCKFNNIGWHTLENSDSVFDRSKNKESQSISNAFMGYLCAVI